MVLILQLLRVLYSIINKSNKNQKPTSLPSFWHSAPSTLVVVMKMYSTSLKLHITDSSQLLSGSFLGGGVFFTFLQVRLKVTTEWQRLDRARHADTSCQLGNVFIVITLKLDQRKIRWLFGAWISTAVGSASRACRWTDLVADGKQVNRAVHKWRS